MGAAHGAGFIIGPALGGFLSIYGFSMPGFVAAVLTGLNFLFAFFFLPESNTSPNFNRQTFASADGYWRRLARALKKPLLGTVFVILFIITLAFSAIPVMVPLLGIAFFSFAELEMSYFFMYIGIVQIVLQGFLIGRLSTKWREETLIISGSFLMTMGVFCISQFPNIIVFILSITIMSSGVGILNTVLPSFISMKAPLKEQCGILGVAQSMGSIARIPGPLIGGFVAEIFGLNIAFIISAIIVLIAFGLGLKVFQVYKFPVQSTKNT